jgi:hypothetical protein
MTGLTVGNPASYLWKKVMAPLHKGMVSQPLYDASKMVEVTVCLDCGKLATLDCELDVRTHESKVSRLETVMVYPEDAPTATCDCHVVVDYCLDCKRVANSGCVNVVKRSLIKMTQERVDEIFAASKVGLVDAYCAENYIYLVDKQGNDLPFHGFEGNKNLGVEMPYLVCNIHKPVVVPPEPTVPTEGIEPTE